MDKPENDFYDKYFHEKIYPNNVTLEERIYKENLSKRNADLVNMWLKEREKRRNSQCCCIIN